MTTEQSMALKAVVEAVVILTDAGHLAVAHTLEEAVIALADEVDQQRARAEAAEAELREERRKNQ